MKRLRKLKNACRGLKSGEDNIRGQGLPARRHKVNCFRASEPRPYELSDSIIHVLTHFFSEWGKPQEVIELPSDLDIVNVFIMK